MQSNAKPVPVTVRYTLLKQSTNLIEKKVYFYGSQLRRGQNTGHANVLRYFNKK